MGVIRIMGSISVETDISKVRKNFPMRIGQGFDSHKWDEDEKKPLMLGGIEFESEYSLKGHSDGDVVIHACIDSLLGAAGMGDIGMLFPDNDPEYKNADSTKLLETVISKLKASNWEILNVDCSVITERPKILPKKREIESKLSEIIDAPFSIKGKHPEGMEGLNGIMCIAVALIQEKHE